MPAAKHLDVIMGIDFHVATVPPSPVPAPYIGIVFDPFDYLPFIGSTVMVNGLHRAQAGTAGVATPPHLPVPSVFAPPASNESEMFMGSTTVNIDGDAGSYAALPVLSCQTVGMPAPLRPKGSPPKSLVLPTCLVLPIPSGPPVMIGGPPTISLMALGMRAGFSALGKLGKGIRRLQRGSGRVGDAMRSATKSLNNAGESLASTLRLGPTARNRIERAVCTVTGHPVDVATGKVFTDFVDLELPGLLPLKFERVWYSTSTYSGPLGHGWHHSYDAGLYLTEDVVLFRAPDGRLVSLPALEAGQGYYDETERLTLLREGEGYSIRTSNHLLFTFLDVGRPHREHVLRAVSDSSQSAIRLNYDKAGRLIEIVDSVGRSIQLQNDALGRITHITAPHPDQTGQRFVVLEYGYDAEGNLCKASDALRQSFHYEYRRHLLLRETNRNGLSFHFEYDGPDEHARCVRTWGDGDIYAHRLSYDIERNITTVTNSLGNKAQYQHRGGVVVRSVDALGGITRTEYDECDRKIHEIDPLGGSRRLRYDARGNLVEVQDPDGSTLRLQYDAQDRPIEATDPNGGVWTFTYDSQGRIVERADPLGHASRFTYSGPRLVAFTDSAGFITRIDYDAQGNVSAVLMPNGAKRAVEYDALGRAIARTDPNGNVQMCTLDLLGRPIRIDEPDGNVRTLAYDAEGNVIHIVDAHTEVSFRYQGMGRLRERIQSGSSVRFDYDTEEQLIGIANEHGHVYRFEHGPTGEILAEHGFDGIARVYTRDLAGRVTSVTRASGLRSVYRYDGAGRVRVVEHSDGSRDAYRYRQDGELVEADNSTCRVTLERDARGRILRESCDGHWVASAYDPRGWRTRMRSSLGAVQCIERDARGNIVGLSHTFGERDKPFVARYTRDPLGLELERHLPGGVHVRWQRDKLGRPVQQELSVASRILRIRTHQWSQDDRLGGITDTMCGSIEYGYDDGGSLAWATCPDGSRELRVPDAIGNLFRTEARSDRKYGPAGQLLEATDARGRLTKYTYDAEGNLVEKQRDDGQRWRYRWGADGMLREVQRPDGSSVSFGYDALGRRVRKTFGARTTRWLWDGNTLLHEWVDHHVEPRADQLDDYADIEASEKIREALRGSVVPRGPPEDGTLASPITWVFEPESFTPVAKLVGKRLYSILGDHLGTPNTMLDERGTVVWSGHLGAYGELQGLEGDRAACPFRWPGQYEDVETGLYYNRFRYYDPDAGQYTSQDPIRLAGGLSVYSYVANPTRTIDPAGLNPQVIALGLQNTRETVTYNGQTFTGTSKDTLARFAKKKNASTFESFDKVGTLDQNIAKAMDDSSTIHFNLQGMSDESVQAIKASPDPSSFRPGSTNWELATVLSKPDLQAKTQFWEGPDVKSTRCP